MEHQESPEPGDSPPPASTRRGFLGFMTVVLGGLPVVGGLFAALRSGLSPAFSTRPDRIPLCKLGDVPESGIKEVAISYEMRQGPVMESVGKVVFVTRDPKTKEILAMAGECTHLSCPVQSRELKVEGTDQKAPLTCPCHGGMFSQTGQPIAGPPEKPLRRLKLDTIPEDPDELVYLLES